MRKLKFFILTLLSVLTLGLFVVIGSKVEAASHDIGSATVTTTTNSGDTKTWDFKVSSTKTLANGDDVNGVVVYGGYSKGSAGIPSIKKDNVGLDFFLHGYVLVPVVSENSEGTISVMLTSNSGGRYIDLISNSGTVTSSVLTSKTDTMDYTFTEDDVWTINEKYYVKLWSEVYTGNPLTPSGDTNSNSGEIKMGTVSIVLSNGTYGEAATLHTVTYMDGTTPLKTDEEAVDGSNISYTPKKYGYDFEGWYTDASLDSQYKVNTSTYTVTGDVTLYANWTAWTNTGITEYTLTNSAIEKIATGIDGNLSADLALTPSIYTVMSGVAMTTTNVTLPGASSATQAPCFNTNGAVKTTGNGLKFTAPSNGTLTLWAGSGSSEERTIKVTNGDTDLTPSSGSVTVPASYAPHEIVYTLEEGTTYYIGGSKGVRIYYVSFEEEAAPTVTVTALQQEADSGNDTTYIRFIAIVSGVTDINSSDFTFNVYCTKGSIEKSITRSVRTCSEIQLGGSTYSATLPGESTPHTFDGTNEFYAVYVIEMTNATYAGCTVKAGFTYGGTEYLTSGYTFA